MAFVKKTPRASLALSEAEYDLPDLLQSLQAADASIRNQAAHKLSIYPEAVDALCERLLQESSVAVRTSILTSLIKINTSAAAAGLVRILRVANASLRNDVISGLQEMQQVSLPHVEGLLEDEDPDARIYGIYILSAIQHPRVPLRLLQVIEFESHINVWGAALDALTEVGTPDMIPAIESSLHRFDCEYGQFAVEFAVRRICG
jgi:HEAT repeat protein